MENYQELIELTKTLQQYTEKALEQFELVKHNDNVEFDFYKDVKPFADLVKNTAIEWKSQVFYWIEKEHPKHIHQPQIISACENLEIMSAQAFFKATKEKRFKEMYHAVQYLFDNILEKVE